MAPTRRARPGRRTGAPAVPGDEPSSGLRAHGIARSSCHAGPEHRGARRSGFPRPPPGDRIPCGLLGHCRLARDRNPEGCDPPPEARSLPRSVEVDDQNTKVARGIGSSPAFLGSSVDRAAGVRARSTIWMIGSDRRVATATVFFVRLPLPFRAAGREVITLDRIQSPRDSVRLRLYGSHESTVNVGTLIPLHRTGSAV
jgi:hypothetical protein